MATNRRKKTNKITRQMVAKWGLIPLALFAFWVILTLRYIYINSGFTILIHSHDRNSITQGKIQELLKGEKIKAEFTAKENNLGIIAVRFNTFFRINEDIVIFRIKEEGAKNWIAENSYTTPQFQPNKHFTFGLPIQTESEGKTYEFEIESIRGEPLNAVALSPIDPIFVTKYQYLENRILSDRDYMATYLQRKFINTFTNIDFLLSFIAFSLPFFVYLVTILFFDKYLSGKYYIVLLPVVIMVFLSLFNNTRNDGAVLGFTVFWIYLNYVYRLESTYSYAFSLLFLICSAVLYYLNMDQLSKNLSMWGFMLLVGGVVLQIVEFIFKYNDLKPLSRIQLEKWLLWLMRRN